MGQRSAQRWVPLPRTGTRFAGVAVIVRSHAGPAAGRRQYGSDAFGRSVNNASGSREAASGAGLAYLPCVWRVPGNPWAHFQFVGTDPALEAAGKAYYEYRAALMVNNNEGMTKKYHRFPRPL